MAESAAEPWSSPGSSSLPPQAARAPVSVPTSAVRATARRRGIVVVVFKAVPFLDVVAGRARARRPSPAHLRTLGTGAESASGVGTAEPRTPTLSSEPVRSVKRTGSLLPECDRRLSARGRLHGEAPNAPALGDPRVQQVPDDRGLLAVAGVDAAEQGADRRRRDGAGHGLD